MGHMILACLLFAASTSGHVKLVGVTAPDGSITASSKRVARKVKSEYLVGIRRCYQHALATDSAARGELAMKLTVAESGRVMRAEVEGMDEDLDSCVRDLTRKWMFPGFEASAQEFRMRIMLTP